MKREDITKKLNNCSIHFEKKGRYTNMYLDLPNGLKIQIQQRFFKLVELNALIIACGGINYDKK